MTFGREIDESESAQIIHRALHVGVNVFDTANSYSNGVSEEILGRTLKGARNRVIIATKFFNAMGSGPNDRGASRYHIMDAVEASLRRLQTDHIDLYQIHHFDPDTPVEETLAALDDLVHAGKVRYIGCSNFAAWQFIKALWLSERNGFVRFVSLQPRFSLGYRETEREVLPMCMSEGIAVIAYAPLAGGMLTGKYKPGEPPPVGSRWHAGTSDRFQAAYINDKNFRITAALEKYAEQRAVPKEQLAIAWVMSHPAVTASIVGARTVGQLETAVAAYELRMTRQEHDAISRLADEA